MSEFTNLTPVPYKDIDSLVRCPYVGDPLLDGFMDCKNGGWSNSHYYASRSGEDYSHYYMSRYLEGYYLYNDLLRQTIKEKKLMFELETKKRFEVPVPTEPVENFYTMNPETEEVLYGDSLVEGMVVLIESNLSRENGVEAGEFVSEYQRERFETTNYWCRVTKIRRNEGLIKFVGVYANGVQRSRHYNETHCWLVKKSD